MLKSQSVLKNDAGYVEKPLESNIYAAINAASLVKSTIGPCGLDKMILTNDEKIRVTSDGATIFSLLEFEQPAARIMQRLALNMDREVGDGISTSVLFAGELIQNAGVLINKKLHPTTIANGYNLALKEAVRVLKKNSVRATNGLLKSVASTSLNCCNLGANERHRLAEVCTDAAVASGIGGDFDMNVRIVNVEGKSLTDVDLFRGIALYNKRADERMPKRVENARIAVLMDMRQKKKPGIEMGTLIKGPDVKMEISDPGDMTLLGKVMGPQIDIIEKVISSGANVIFYRRDLFGWRLDYLARKGVLAVKLVEESDLDRIALATGAQIVPRAEYIRTEDLGKADAVWEEGQHAREMICIKGGVNDSIVTVLAPSIQRLGPAGSAMVCSMRAVNIAMSDGRVVAGGGASEMEVAMHLRNYARKLNSRETLAVEAFADSLEAIPRAIAVNAGMNHVDVLIELRAKHSEGKKDAGICIHGEDAVISNATQYGIVEPFLLKQKAIAAAVDVVNMILRIDGMFAAHPEDESIVSGMVKAAGEVGPEPGVY